MSPTHQQLGYGEWGAGGGGGHLFSSHMLTLGCHHARVFLRACVLPASTRDKDCVWCGKTVLSFAVSNECGTNQSDAVLSPFDCGKDYCLRPPLTLFCCRSAVKRIVFLLHLCELIFCYACHSHTLLMQTCEALVGMVRSTCFEST